MNSYDLHCAHVAPAELNSLGALTPEDRAALDFQQQEALNEQARQARRQAWYATRRSLGAWLPMPQSEETLGDKF